MFGSTYRYYAHNIGSGTGGGGGSEGILRPQLSIALGTIGAGLWFTKEN